ncbi:CDP-glycerol glycerophosphotransferase family protein [Nocardioides sp. CN2-186]|uniref:CDP-glycerol glycerophosphotransferase family protein n=1 Tax=Nocardioides tweenelious TaxID=3156607 RepID=UPI0032B4AE4B
MRNLVLDVVLGTLRVTLRVLSLVVPQTRSVVVTASPETEGNGIEVARALVRRYAGRVVWLRDGGPLPEQVRALADQGLVVLPKASLAGLWAYLRAESVLFTHGLYGSPKPCARKPIVNIWHGDGPKDIRPDRNVGAPIASTYLVGSTPLFSQFQASALGVPADRVLVTGNPRTDQFWHPVEPDRLAALGITGDFVLWMPTFRKPRAVGAVRVRADHVATDSGHKDLDVLLDALAARGLQLVVKPHPMDADRRQWSAAVTVDEDDLVSAGVSLYSLLGASSGLVTDYSSVWVDYLLLDRPIAFVVPDRRSYDRALYPADILDWVPGEVVDPQDRPFAMFLDDLDGRCREGSAFRQAVSRRIGLHRSSTAADDLVTELVKLGVLSSG